MLSKQLQDQIEQEAEATTRDFKDNNDYQAGKINGYTEGYEAAGEKYATLYETAIARAESAERALKKINDTGWVLGIQGCINVAHKALTPKTGEDALHKEP